MSEVNHPRHYGSTEDQYEAIKVIEAWGLGFCLGNVLKYIRRAGKKGAALVDLQKAAWYLNREIARLSAPQPTPGYLTAEQEKKLANCQNESYQQEKEDMRRPMPKPMYKEDVA